MDKYKYIQATDEIQKEVTTVQTVTTSFKQYENELETLIAQRDAIQTKIDELDAIIALKV